MQKVLTQVLCFPKFKLAALTAGGYEQLAMVGAYLAASAVPALNEAGPQYLVPLFTF